MNNSMITYEAWFRPIHSNEWQSLGQIAGDGFIEGGIHSRFFIFSNGMRIEMPTNSFCFKFSAERNALLINKKKMN